MIKCRHYIATIEQYEQERDLMLQHCPILNADTCVYAPSNADFAPEVRAYIQKQFDAALGPRLQAFVAQVAELLSA